jgi:hypothetical protein
LNCYDPETINFRISTIQGNQVLAGSRAKSNLIQIDVLPLHRGLRVEKLGKRNFNHIEQCVVAAFDSIFN